MITLSSKTNPDSVTYKENLTASIDRMKVFYDRLRQISDRSDDTYVKRHRERGRLLVRERIDLLVDHGSPFLEFSAFAAWDQYNNSFPAAGMITGIGMIEGKLGVIIANDSTVKGGTYVKETIKKHLRALEIAFENRLPVVYLVDSGGIFLPEQAQVFADKEHFGRIFYWQARLSANEIPQVAAVMGSCTAGGAYIPAMSDETIMVRNQATIFLAGPPLVKAATGEEITAEELGGAEVHTSISGVADHIAEDDRHAISIIRDIFKTFKPTEHAADLPTYDEPRVPIHDIQSIIPADGRNQIDPYEILARILDNSDFHEFKANYGKTLITGFGHIMGYRVGILANNGILFSESALKGTHFIEICNQRKIPIIFLHNITGFMVGKDYEHGGIAKDGAKMVNAVANSTVPKITIITGGSYGAGNYAMAGRAYQPRFLFTWPNAKVSVMGGEQASHVLKTVAGKPGDDKPGGSNTLLDQYTAESSVYFGSSRLWDDGIIDPADTRTILGLTLSVVSTGKYPLYKPGIYRM